MYQNMVCFTDSNIQHSLNFLNASFLSGTSARAEPKKHPKWIILLTPDLLVLFWLVGLGFLSFYSFLLLRCKDPSLYKINFKSILSL